MQLDQKLLRKRVVIGALCLFGAICLWLVISYGFLSVTVTGNTSSSDITYTLKSQPNGRGATSTTRSTSLRRIVRRGSYEVTATSGEGGSLAVVKTAGFLRSVSVEIPLTKERERQFVGNNPTPCNYYAGKVLVSYDCTGSVGASLHTPATKETPTTVKPIGAFANHATVSILPTKEGNMALVHENAASEDEPGGWAVYMLTGDFVAQKKTTLSKLDGAVTYNMAPYKDGGLVYSSDFTRSYAISASSLAPTASPLPSFKTDLVPYRLTASGSRVARQYSSANASTESGSDAGTPSGVKSTIVVNGVGSQKFLELAYLPSSLSFCGTNKLCVLSATDLSVYDVSGSGSSVKRLYSFGSIDYAVLAGDQVAAIKEGGVWRLDADQGTGQLDYSFGGNYTGCGLQTAAQGYTICAIDNRQVKVALHINTSATNRDAIDKKIANLKGLGEVQAVSIYDHIITISPNAGSLEFDAVNGGYNYNQSKLTSVKRIIDHKIKQLGINTTAYTIVYTL